MFKFNPHAKDSNNSNLDVCSGCVRLKRDTTWAMGVYVSEAKGHRVLHRCVGCARSRIHLRCLPLQAGSTK